MTSPVNFTDPTVHYFAKIDIAGHYNSGSSVVVVPDPESRPDTTTGSSTGSGSGSSGSGFGGGGSSSWVSEPESFLETCGNYWYEQAMVEYGSYVAMPASFDAHEFELGIGGGMGASFKLAELLNLNLVVRADPRHIKYDNYVWDEGTSSKISASGSLVGSFLEIGDGFVVFNLYDGPQEVSAKSYGFLGIDLEFYFGAGGEIKIGIDLGKFVIGLEKYER